MKLFSVIFFALLLPLTTKSMDSTFKRQITSTYYPVYSSKIPSSREWSPAPRKRQTQTPDSTLITIKKPKTN